MNGSRRERALPAGTPLVSLLPSLLLISLLLAVLAAGSARAHETLAWSLYHRGDSDHDGPQDKRVAPTGTIHALQYLLRARGYSLVPDRVFGSATDQAVRQFQKAHGLIPNGETNHPTWEALIVRLKLGSAGPAVAAAQLRLENNGFAVPLTGHFDARMKAALLKYQVQNGLTPDALIGPGTWNALLLGEGEGD